MPFRGRAMLSAQPPLLGPVLRCQHCAWPTARPTPGRPCWRRLRTCPEWRWRGACQPDLPRSARSCHERMLVRATLNIMNSPDDEADDADCGAPEEFVDLERRLVTDP